MPGFIQNNNLYAYKGRTSPRRRRSQVTSPTSPTIRILTRNSASNVNLGQLMRYELEAIGLKAKTEAIPTAQLFPVPATRRTTATTWRGSAGRPTTRIRRTSSTCCSTEVDSDRRRREQQLVVLQQREVQRADEQGGTDDRRRPVQDVRQDRHPDDEGRGARRSVLNSNNRILVSSRISNYTYNDANTYTAWNALVIK